MGGVMTLKLLVNVVAGVLFGIGLAISGMADPEKVLNFLDLTGTWDPSLAFVMVGAIAVTALGFALVTRRSAPVLEARFELPAKSPVDIRLVTGAAVFGIGWGLGGYCPGPAIASLALGASGTLVFVPAMLAGIALAEFLRLRSKGDHQRTADG
jgi:uncharacterized protein